jgi:hypothetical protein
MAIADPRPLAELNDILPIASVSWEPALNQELPVLGSSATIPIDRAAPLWRAVVTLDKMDWQEASLVHTRLMFLHGSLRSFYLTNPLGRGPKLDRDGTVLDGAAVTVSAIAADRTTIALGGLPVGYTLSETDWLQVDFADTPIRHGLFVLGGNGVAGAGGTTGQMPIYPPAWPGLEVGDTVKLIRPAAQVRLTPDSGSLGAIRNALVDGHSFTALQVL